jgi:hypothetical protein
MSTIVSILWAGIIGGTVMQLWVLLLYRIGFTSLNLIRYLGCIVTGTTDGTLNFIAGTAIHFAISLFDAFVYTFVLNFVWGHTGIIEGLIFSIVHANGSGLAIPLADYINPCVRSGAIPPIKLYARGYGAAATITFMSSIVLYGAFTGWFLPFKVS